MRRANLSVSIIRKRLRATEGSVSKWLRWHITDSSKTQGLSGSRVFNNRFARLTWAEYREVSSFRETWQKRLLFGMTTSIVEHATPPKPERNHRAGLFWNTYMPPFATNSRARTQM